MMPDVVFPGQYFDQESNLHYNYFRDYDPSTGRYIESDPVGLSGGINTYLYSNANPNTYIDRYGLIGVIPIIEILAEVGCATANVVIPNEERKWDNRIDDYVDKGYENANARHRRMIILCIEEYEYHKDECKFKECMRQAGEEWDNEDVRLQEFRREGYENNPYRNWIPCSTQFPKR